MSAFRPANPSLAAFLDGLAARGDPRPALLAGDRAVSAAALAAESRRVAGGLAGLGIGAGDRVALWLPNVPAWLALFFACARIGAVAGAINTRFRARELADILDRSGARALVVWPDFKGIAFLDILAEIDPAALDRLETVVLYDDEASPSPSWPSLPPALASKRVVAYRDLARAAPAATGDRSRADDGCVLFTTSGTTRAPKFVLHTQRSLVRHALDVAPAAGYLAPDTVLYQGLPFCGVFGFCQTMAALAAGASIALQPWFEAEAAVALIERHRVTAFNATDEMLERILAADPDGRRTQSFRHGGFAAFKAPERRDLVDAYDRRGATLHGVYGMSEVQALHAIQPMDAPAEIRVRGGGVPVSPDARVRVRAADGDRLLGANETGLLEFAGPSVMREYFGDPAATRAAFTEDGYLRSGDLGHLTESGGFVYLARAGDALRLSGFLVSPGEIESCLEDDPAVARAQVVGAETPAGPRAVAFVVPAPGVAFAEDAIVARCRRALAGYKVPARVFAVDAFPMTESANGLKIQRTRLREEAARRLAEGQDLR